MSAPMARAAGLPVMARLVDFSRKYCLFGHLIRPGPQLFESRRYLPSFINQEYIENQEQSIQNAEDGEGGDRFLQGSAKFDKLYPGHIPTTSFQKVLLAGGSGVTAFFNPWRDDMVAYFGETTGSLALINMKKKMLADPVGRQILDEKPRIHSTTVDLAYLAGLSEGTLGREYITFMKKNKISTDSRRPVSFIDDADLAYTMTRYREIHDLVHAVLGMPTHMLGEVVVKWVEGLQTGLPMCLLGAMFSPLRFGPVYRRRYLQSYWPWALRTGLQAKFFMNIYFEKHWEEDLGSLKEQWNLEPPPRDKKHV